MSDFNRVILLGRIGNDLELKTSAQGKSYLRLSIATHSFRAAKDKSEKTTHWHRVVVFGAHAEICAAYLKKGSTVLVEGSLECRTYTDSQGRKVSTVSVIADRVNFLGGKGSVDVQETTEDVEEDRVAMAASA